MKVVWELIFLKFGFNLVDYGSWFTYKKEKNSAAAKIWLFLALKMHGWNAIETVAKFAHKIPDYNLCFLLNVETSSRLVLAPTANVHVHVHASQCCSSTLVVEMDCTHLWRSKQSWNWLLASKLISTRTSQHEKSHSKKNLSRFDHRQLGRSSSWNSDAQSHCRWLGGFQIPASNPKDHQNVGCYWWSSLSL